MQSSSFRLLARIGLLAGLLFAKFAMATEISPDALSRLMHLSGIEEQVLHYPEMIALGVDAGAAQAQHKLSPGRIKAIHSAIASAYSPKPILGTIRKAIEADISNENALELLAWLESDLGKRISQGELSASTQSGLNTMMQSSSELFSDEEKLALIRQIDHLIKGTETNMEILVDTRMLVTLSRVVSEPMVMIDTEALREQITSQLEPRRPEMEKLEQLALLYAYRDISGADLDKYINFLSSPSARQYTETTSHSLRSALLMATQYLMVDLIKLRTEIPDSKSL